MRRSGRERDGRQSLHLTEKIRILIVCEGRETEPNYFRGLRDEEAVRQKFFVVVKKGKGGSCLAVVQQAFAELEKASGRGENYDEVWCVFDIEQIGRQRQLNEARTLAGRHEIRLALSNPCFECYLLAHFVRTRGSFANCDKVVEELNKHWRREFAQDYEKNDEGLYARLANRTRTAIDNARKVRVQDWASSQDIAECNSATNVYLLIERLLSPSE